jgi:N utilization substance protein A
MTKTFIETLAEKKKISVEYAIDSFKDALSNVYLSEYEGANIDVEYNKNNDSFIIHRNFKVVSDEFADDENSSYDDENEIPLSKAKKINPKISINATIGQDITLEGLDKHLQKKIMQTLNHNISIESNKFIYKNWNDKKGKVISSEVISEENGKYTVKINEEIFGILPYDEQIKGEKLQLGKKYSFFVKDVLEHSRD